MFLRQRRYGRERKGICDSHEWGGLREYDGALTEVENTGGRSLRCLGYSFL